MSIKLLHLADIHYSRERKDLVISSLEHVEETAKRNNVDFITIAGDLFDAAVLNSGSSELPRFIEAIKRLGDLAPTAMVYGTPSHDVDQSLDLFKSIDCKYGITILEPGQAYFYSGNVAKEIYHESEIAEFAESGSALNYPEALIFGIPEPRKKYLLSDTSAGKDETEEAIRSAMHKLCFMLAAKRREYSDIPCIVLYHGDVAGSVLQNNQTVERGTGIAITIDELADIGADFNCLGHIHLPQQIGNLPAFYAGSITKNFGETHKAGYNLVDVDVGSYKIQRIDWPIPQNYKIEATLNEWRDDPKFMLGEQLDITGKKIWLEITCTKEDRAFINADNELQGLFIHGAVEGSRVTVCDIPVETVRAAEITEVNTPAKKFEVWAGNSNVEFKDSHIKKIETLDTEAAQGTIKAKGEWELKSMFLKGSIGIMKGIKKEEIVVDFESFENGLIALTGTNGKGKTTLIENCHPYPQLLTRKGKLQDHFLLKDSFREVIYRNCTDNVLWKFLIQIDGQNKSGSCKYFIFKQADGSEWEPLPGVDGNLKPYEEALNAIFGPIELFLRTAFITQRATKNLPDITDATAGEKKSLFVALAGIDYLQVFSDSAAEKAKLETAKKHDAEIKAEVLHAVINKKPQEEESLKGAEAALKTKNVELAEITKQGKAVKADVERLQTAWSAEQVRQQQENDAKASIDAISLEINNLALDIDLQKEAADNKANYERDITEYEAQQKIIEAETTKRQGFTEANLKKQQEYTKQKTAHDENLKTVEVERDNLCDKRNSIERLVASAESDIRLAEKDEEVERNQICKSLFDRKVEIDKQIITARSNILLFEREVAEIIDNCPTCDQTLPEDKLNKLKTRREEYIQKTNLEKQTIEKLNADNADVEDKLAEVTKQSAEKRNAKVARITSDIRKHNDRLAEINSRVEELEQQISELAFVEPDIPSLGDFDDTKLKSAITKQESINISQTRSNLAQAQQATVRIEALWKQKNEKQSLYGVKEAEHKKVWQEPSVGIKIKSDLDWATNRHAELTEQYTAVKSDIARTEAGIDAVKKTLADIAEKEKEYSNMKAEIQTTVIEGQEWELIAKAFGKDGIQALELDALAPGISETANRILESAYGDRFRIEIRTTRIGGAGKKTKQIEDFLIYVIDSEDGEAVLLDDKSGGEAVWIKRAIYDAFAVIRKRNTNFAFLTCFQDENDGALDSAAKTAYCRMLEAAHAESKLRHTIIITHSNEVKAMIEQRIDIEDLITGEAA